MNDVDRPIPVTVICALGILGSMVGFFNIFNPSRHALPSWYQPLMIVLTAAGVVPFIGMWMMKRWGVLLYAAMGIITLALLVLTDHFKPASMIPPVIVLVVGFGYFTDME